MSHQMSTVQLLKWLPDRSRWRLAVLGCVKRLGSASDGLARAAGIVARLPHEAVAWFRLGHKTDCSDVVGWMTKAMLGFFLGR